MKRGLLFTCGILLGGCSVADPGSGPLPELPGDPAPSAVAEARASVAASAATVPRAQAAPGDPPACPDDMVLAGRFCVDRYEAHLVVVAADGASQVHPHHLRPAPGITYVAANREGVFPQGYVSRVESEAACMAAGKRLCSRSEWQLACRGTGGARPSPGDRCNNGKTHLLARMFDQPFRYDEHFNSPELNRVPGFLAKTGEYAACQSEIGAHDMVGNLHEWVSDTVSRAFIVQMETDSVRRQWQPSQVGNGTFMGGFYSTSGEHGPGCLFTTIAHEPAYHDYSTGFRCCKSLSASEPAAPSPGR